jgi:hypothetical protein
MMEIAVGSLGPDTLTSDWRTLLTLPKNGSLNAPLLLGFIGTKGNVLKRLRLFSRNNPPGQCEYYPNKKLSLSML